MLQSSSLHSFCPSLLLFFFLDASGHRILFVSSSPICFRVRSPCCLKLVSVLLYLLLFFSLGTFGTQSSPCFPPVSVLVSRVGSYSLPEFCFSGCLMAADSSCLSFVSMLSCLSPCLFYYSPPRAQCSLFWLLWGHDSPCVPSVSAPVSLLVLNLFWHFFLRCCCSLWVLPGHRMLIGCSLSIVCFRTCRPCCLHFVPFFLSFFPFFLSFFLSLSLSLSLALLLSRCLLGPLILLVCHLFPYVSSLFSPICIVVSLVLSKLYPSFAPHCYSSLRLLWEECFSLLVFLRISLLACLSIAVLVSVCFGTKPIIRYIPLLYPRLLPHVTLLAFLLVSNLSPYHLSTTVLLSGSAACGTESKVSFLFPFFPYLFIYSFSVLSSPSLQLLSLGAFGTQDSPCLPCVPICVLIQPIFSPFSYSILLSYSFYSLCCCFCLGFRTFRCFGAINITESIIYVPSVTLLQCSSFHSLLSLPVTVILPGCFWAQDTLRGARWQRILLASHLFPYLSPCLFPTCFFIFLSPLRFFSPGEFGQRNLLVSRSSLSIAQCSSFWWLWGQDSSLICFRTRLSTSLSHVAVLSGCFRGTICSLSFVCLRAYPPCSLQLVPLLLSFSLSLSRCSSL